MPIGGHLLSGKDAVVPITRRASSPMASVVMARMSSQETRSAPTDLPNLPIRTACRSSAKSKGRLGRGSSGVESHFGRWWRRAGAKHGAAPALHPAAPQDQFRSPRVYMSGYPGRPPNRPIARGRCLQPVGLPSLNLLKPVPESPFPVFPNGALERHLPLQTDDLMVRGELLIAIHMDAKSSITLPLHSRNVNLISFGPVPGHTGGNVAI